jgi:dTDP-4-amino-4,6-dideoxygalactose transaminase
MIITKKPADPSGHTLPFYYFPRARDAFEHVLRKKAVRGKTILLPAYIGWGKVEGSGVFDPVRAAKSRFVFYRLNGRLQIDLASLKDSLADNPGSILVLIHYFGFKDENISRIKEWAATAGCMIVEDFAHGLFTFFANPVVDFDYAFFSLHKMLPYPNLTGGLLLSKSPEPRRKEYCSFYRYNLGLIARRRRDNYRALLERLTKSVPSGLMILRPEMGDNVPESFPILLENRDKRNLVHARMNAEGFGLISLYHELIREIDESFSSEREISDRITNLPIHQDADPGRIHSMADRLSAIVNEIGS